MDGFITEENVVSSESNEWSLDEVKKALSLLRWQRESINSQVHVHTVCFAIWRMTYYVGHCTCTVYIQYTSSLYLYTVHVSILCLCTLLGQILVNWRESIV